jgi:hypothetical protein
MSRRTPDKSVPATRPSLFGRSSAPLPPTLEEAKRRLAEAAGGPQPWLTPEGLAVFADAPTEDLGPATYRRPAAD